MLIYCLKFKKNKFLLFFVLLLPRLEVKQVVFHSMTGRINKLVRVMEIPIEYPQTRVLHIHR